jgi:hypothetical protein
MNWITDAADESVMGDKASPKSSRECRRKRDEPDEMADAIARGRAARGRMRDPEPTGGRRGRSW